MDEPTLITADRRSERDAKKNDARMSARGSCDQCRFCGIASAMSKEINLICRKSPPTVIAQLVPKGPNEAAWIGTAMWASVTKFDWCGEWKAVEH
jgi:hypothetical protein